MTASGPARPRAVAPFLIARDPVTAARTWPSSPTAATRGASSGPTRAGRGGARGRIEAPLYWERDGGGGWTVRRFDRGRRCGRGDVLCHVCAHEADAHAAVGRARGCPRRPSGSGRPGRERPTPAPPTSTSSASPPAPAGAYDPAPSGCRADARRRLGVDRDAFGGYPGVPRLPLPRSTPRSSSARATACCAAAPGPRSRSRPGPASATGTCPSGARSSRACGWPGTPRERGPRAPPAALPPRRPPPRARDRRGPGRRRPRGPRRRRRSALPPKHFYDERGSELFEQITRLPEYYQSRTELRILRRVADGVVARHGVGELVELGSGASRKTRGAARRDARRRPAGALRALRRLPGGDPGGGRPAGRGLPRPGGARRGRRLRPPPARGPGEAAAPPGWSRSWAGRSATWSRPSGRRSSRRSPR